MDLIHLLPDSVANQIAAGEVIQRPASVVKELVENAVDAGGRHIEVIVVDAGRTSIQVIDDGKGMSETDARLAFERHATSKIRQADDLFTLTTMGFRGEALPSIAAVAQVELTTRTAADEVGTQLCIEGSRVVSQEPVACPVGAKFAVKNIFYNVPARRKFLKTAQTELANISTELERIVLVHPDIAFLFSHGSLPLLNLEVCSSAGAYKQRIAQVFGKKVVDALLPVEVETSMVTIRGFVGKPESSRRRGVQQFFFVNNRYMRHPYFHKAVCEAFANLIPTGEQIPYFLYMEVPPADIDVNIHPTKTEIKFENEQGIWQILLAAIRETLGRSAAIPTIDFDTEGRPVDMPVFNPGTFASPPQQTPQVHMQSDYTPFSPSSGYHRPDVPAGWETLYTRPSENETQPMLPDLSLPTSEADAPRQYRGTYIVTSAPAGLMLIHQHRAHLRVLYDRYMQTASLGALPSQRLLFPDLLQLSARNSALLEGSLADWEHMGFDFSNLGGGTWSLTAIPAGLEGVDTAQLVVTMLDALAEHGTLDTDSLRSRMALQLARSAAIPVGQVLSTIEMQHLLADLLGSSSPNHTPDGHTITALLDDDTIAKMFK